MPNQCELFENGQGEAIAAELFSPAWRRLASRRATATASTPLERVWSVVWNPPSQLVTMAQAEAKISALLACGVAWCCPWGPWARAKPPILCAVRAAADRHGGTALVAAVVCSSVRAGLFPY